MLHDEYQIVSHAEIGALATQIYDLAALAFGAYPGVLRPSAAHRAWYVRRPGMDVQLSRAALYRGQLVSNVFVTVATMRLGAQPVNVGIVDTVMTHPDHRRRGLARRLLSEAIQGMRQRGLAASLLYTMPDSRPYRLYHTLGYEPHAPVRYLRRVQGAGSVPAPSLQRAGPQDDARLMAFLDAQLGAWEGYVPLDEPLWRWRKRERPAELPATVYYVVGAYDNTPAPLLGCATICRAPIVASSAEAASYILTDLALAPQADAGATLETLLSAVPAGGEALTLAASANAPLTRLLEAAGFAETGREVAMLLPLMPRLRDVLSAPPQTWYVLAESVIGV